MHMSTTQFSKREPVMFNRFKWVVFSRTLYITYAVWFVYKALT